MTGIIIEKDQQFHFTVIAWGADYVGMLTSIVLPNFLGQGNIPDFPHRASSRFRIYSTEEHREEITSSPGYIELATLLPIEFIDLRSLTDKYSDLPSFANGEKYSLMNIGHRDAIAVAEECKAYIIFLFPDHVYPVGTCLRLAHYAAEKIKVVMIGGIRTNREDVIPELLQNVSGTRLNIEAHQLVDMILRHRHAMVQSLFWESPISSTWPSHIYFEVGDEGLILRGFHLHPLMVLADRRAGINYSLDVDYYHSVCDSMSDIYIVDSSEELMCLELTSKSLPDSSRVPIPFSNLNAAKFLATQHLDSVLHCANTPILFFRKSPTEIWEGAIKHSDDVVEQVLVELVALNPKSDDASV